ncbi:MAG: glycerol-3-phosphate 1-O-acyltransferase PlsY [Clostridiales bacterium]|nr:glycerol-3-phosphate 1-O-acyltransferase PlsY [Clostridiales bacterium]
MSFSFFFVLIISYVLGSVNCGIIISKLIHKKDIRAFGSGNAGATNVYRTFGAKSGVIVLFGDMAKGVIAILLAQLAIKYFGAADYTLYFAGLLCVLGHMFPVFFKFKGGKGVATTTGIILFTEPLVFIIVFIVFFLIAFLFKYISLASIVAAAAYTLGVMVLVSVKEPVLEMLIIRIIVSFIIGSLIIFSHRENIKRIKDGTEKKFKVRRNR